MHKKGVPNIYKHVYKHIIPFLLIILKKYQHCKIFIPLYKKIKWIKQLIIIKFYFKK